MRISTSMVYGLGGRAVQSQSSDLYKLQGQMSSGKRLSTPSDDPLAAARVLEISQSKSGSEQLSANADYATSALQTQEATLTRISDLLSEVRTLGVQAGDAAYSFNDRQVIATTLEAKYKELISLANTQENGRYIFSGFKGETQPFSETTPGTVAYNGDGGERLIQVTPSRQVPVSAPGVEIFQRIRNGNGTFSVSADSNVTGTTNAGDGVATPGVLLDSTKWNAATIPTGGGFKAVFAQDTTVQPPVTTYDIVAISNGTVVNGNTYNVGDSLLTGAASAATASIGGGPRYPRTYTSETTISLKYQTGDTNPDTAWDLGAEFSVSGQPTSTPTTGIPVTTPDAFTIKPSVNNQDIFSTIYKMVTTLQGGTKAQISNAVSTMLDDLTMAEESVSTTLTTVGVVMQEVDSHKSRNADLILQYKKEISGLEDLDYATAVTDLTLRQSVLEASQKSFLAVQGLSLFQFM